MASALQAAEAHELSALADRRAAAAAVSAASQRFAALQEQQLALCDAEDFGAADELNVAIAAAESALHAAGSALTAAERAASSATAAVLAAAAQEIDAWDEAVLHVDVNSHEQRAARLREAAARLDTVRNKRTALLAERDALVAALAAKEAQLAAVQAEQLAADDAVRRLEHAQPMTAQSANAPREVAVADTSHDTAALAIQLRAVAAQRKERFTARERAVMAVKAAADAEDAALAALNAASHSEAAVSREAALLVTAHAGVQQAVSGAREAAAVAARQLAAAEEQKSLAVATRSFKEAGQFAAEAKALAAERQAAERTVATLAAQLDSAAAAAAGKAHELSGLRAELIARRRGAALARWRRLCAEVSVRCSARARNCGTRDASSHVAPVSPQMGESALAATDTSDASARQQMRDEVHNLRAEADALARTHGWCAADDGGDC
jgi:hypothetical protein